MNGLTLRRPVVVVVVLYAASILLWQRDWLLSGEMYAEMATNYFTNARSGDPATMLFSLDSGYWPLPQRLLSDAVFLLRIDAATVPYVYTCMAVLGAGLLAGSFAHTVFRPLVRCDLVRVATALVLLFSLDIETRGFINFTYLVAIFAVPAVALVCLQPRIALPWWFWTLPPLMASKPHMLVVAPMAALGAALARGRARWLMATMVAVAAVQTAVLAANTGTMQTALFNGPQLPVLTKLRDAVYYGFGLAGGDVVGPWAFQPDARQALLACGLVLCLLTAAFFWRFRKEGWSGGTVLMLAGLALAGGTGAFNALTLTRFWDADFGQLATFAIFRHRVTALAGALLFVAGLCDAAPAWLLARLAPSGRAPASAPFWPAALLVAWLGGTGSYIYAGLIGIPPTFPLVAVGEWQRMAHAIGAPGATACVPVDPLGWSLQQRCTALVWVSPPTGAVPLGDGLTVPAPDPVGSFHVLALGVSVKPLVATVEHVRLRAVLQSDAGQSVFQGEAALRPDGVQVLLMGEAPDGVPGVRAARIESDVPVMLFQNAKVAGPPVATVSWMGR